MSLPKWVYAFDENGPFRGDYPHSSTALDAAEDALKRDRMCLNRPPGTYSIWVARSIPVFDFLKPFSLGQDIAEQIQKQVLKELHFGVPSFTLSDNNAEDLGNLALNFMRERAEYLKAGILRPTKHEFTVE